MVKSIEIHYMGMGQNLLIPFNTIFLGDKQPLSSYDLGYHLGARVDRVEFWTVWKAVREHQRITFQLGQNIFQMWLWINTY